MGLWDLIFPVKCLECKKSGKYLCLSCLRKVPLKGWRGNTFSVFVYRGVIRKAIIALKYKYATEIGKELSQTCVRHIKRYRFPKNVILVPVPVYWHKENIRGFNQSALIGETLAKALKWRFEPGLLLKKKETLPQVALSGEERRRNLNNTFLLNKKVKIPKGFEIAVFDDVATTGSTILEAVKALKETKIKKIWGLTVAG